MNVVVGSFCSPLKVYSMLEDNSLRFKGSVENSGTAPSYFVKSPCGTYLYAGIETEEVETSAIESYKVEGDSLLKISRVSAGGAGPAHLCCVENKHIISTNYLGGEVVVVPIESSTGVLGEPTQIIDHNVELVDSNTGKAKTKTRGAAHAHQAYYLKESSSILVCDLGNDAVYTYAYEPNGAAGAVLKEISRWDTPAGYGPRHLAVHPTAPYAYLVCEEANVLVTLQLDRATGIISSGKEELVYHSTLDKDGLGCFGKGEESMCLAEVLIDADASYLYVSNRDFRIDPSSPRSPAEVQNNRSRCSIAVFAVKAGGAQVDLIQSIATAGAHPRGMALMGDKLVVCNKDEGLYSQVAGTGNIAVFAIDAKTGMLSLGKVTEDIAGLGEFREPTWIVSL